MRNLCKCVVAGIASVSLNSLWRATALVLVASVAAAQVPSAADTPVAWPQSFSITGPKDASFGFPVTQPGQIVVEIQVQSAPVVAMLRGTQAFQTQGTGALRLAYTAATEDVQKALFWNVNVRLVQPAPQGAGANVTVTVQYPPADLGRVQAAMGEARTSQGWTQSRARALRGVDSHAALRERPESERAFSHADAGWGLYDGCETARLPSPRCTAT
jgi:hypothetical protein